jgi:hypothetical protein
VTLEQLAARLHYAWERSRNVGGSGYALGWIEIGEVERQRWIEVARAAASALVGNPDQTMEQLAKEMGWE